MTQVERQNRKRAVASPANDVGRARYSLFRSGYQRIGAALEDGWYLEAISLTESLLSDRLESRLSYLTGVDHGFRNLGPLIKSMRSHETDVDLRTLVDVDVDRWRKRRNTAAHEMLKIEEGKRCDWGQRMLELETVATEGRSLLKRCSALIDAHRRKRKMGLRVAPPFPPN